MAKKKKLGHGTLVLVNTVVFPFLSEWTPPERSRDIVDTTCMDDEAADALDGDPPDYGNIAFSGFYDPDSTEDAAIETFFDNDDINDREATIAVKFRKTGTGTPPTASTWTYNIITYVVRLTKIAQQKVGSKEKMMVQIEGKVIRKPVKSTG
jgi:hypothetical protein